MFNLKTILVDPAVKEAALTQRVIAGAAAPEVSFLEPEHMEARCSGLNLSEGKRILYLTRAPGGMVKPCPSTRSPYLCCRYTIINQILQCPMDCTYCILQDYLDTPVITVYTNIDEILNELDRLMESYPDRYFRFGTGELGDSLALEPLLDLSAQWLAFMAGRRNGLIELKTKSDHVDTLPEKSPGNGVIAWSLNPQTIISREEHGAASLRARLKAASCCQDNGYLLGFHFDPIIWFDGWEHHYTRCVEQLAASVDASRIAWISMGSLRFPPHLKETAIRRFPVSKMMFHEMIRGVDGKMRYPRPLRIKMYKMIAGLLREKLPGCFLYFCMELPDVWTQVLGNTPESNGELDYWFALSLYRRFPELSMKPPVREVYVR